MFGFAIARGLARCVVIGLGQGVCAAGGGGRSSGADNQPGLLQEAAAIDFRRFILVLRASSVLR